MLSFDETIYVEGTYDRLRQRVQEFEARLRDAGLRVIGSSRVGNYRRILARVARVIESPEDDFDFRLLHQAIVECSQLLLIVEELARKPEVLGWRSKAQELLSGHDFPEGKEVHSPGRNTQFELYVAAVCRRAGYHIELAEPDLVVEAAQVRRGIAAKRLKSLGKLKDSLHDASNQLKLSGLSGFVALDLSPSLAASNDEPHVARNRDEAKVIWSETLGKFIRDNRLLIRNSVDHGIAFGLLCFVTAPVVFENQRMLVSVTVCRAVNLCSQHDVRCGEIDFFVERMSVIELE